MRIKLGPVTSQVRGRFGGSVASKGRGSETIRRFTHPTNTQSEARTHARNAFANLQSIFSAFYGYSLASLRDYPFPTPQTPRSWWLHLNLSTMTGETGSTKLTYALPFYPHPWPTVGSFSAWGGNMGVNDAEIHAPDGWTSLNGILWTFIDHDFRTKHAPESWDFQTGLKSPAFGNYYNTCAKKWTYYIIVYQARATDPEGTVHYSVPVTGRKNSGTW